MLTLLTPRILAVLLVVAVPLLHSSRPASAANCDVTSVGFTPLNDLGSGTYQGEEGGLYPGGSNERPATHDAAGRALAEAITPINERIVLISIGMSNTTQEFSRFVPLAMNHPDRNPPLLVVDCAAGGQHAAIAANPNSPYWNVVRQRLAQAGVDSTQVRVAWVKEAVPGPTLPFPDDALELKGYLRAIAQNLHDKFPNLLIAYYSSRIYAGYATGVSQLNPEPWAYQSGFAVKWLIEDQVEGTDPGLNFDPQAGPVEAPWLAWGPYLWADGLVPRSDGLIWQCSDLANDGTHPSTAGANKVAQLLLDHFTSDATATPWFLAGAAAIEDEFDAVSASGLRLLPARPNPLAAATAILLEMSRNADVRVAIVGPEGRLVRLLHDGALPAGNHKLVWNGTDASGRRAAAGVYLVHANDGTVRRSIKLQLMQ